MAASTASSVAGIVRKVMEDEQYAAQVQEAAREALTHGAGSKAWDDYFELFASTPQELSSLAQVNSAGVACNTTYTTLTTVTTPICLTCAGTTTTTTTGS